MIPNHPLWWLAGLCTSDGMCWCKGQRATEMDSVGPRGEAVPLHFQQI
jgi:hypothetical protein